MSPILSDYVVADAVMGTIEEWFTGYTDLWPDGDEESRFQVHVRGIMPGVFEIWTSDKREHLGTFRIDVTARRFPDGQR